MLVGVALVVLGWATIGDAARAVGSPVAGAMIGLAFGVVVVVGADLSWASTLDLVGSNFVVRTVCRRTEFPAARVRDVQAAWWIRFELDDGSKVGAWCASRTYLSAGLGSQGRIDQVAAELRAIAEEFQGGPTGPLERTWVLPRPTSALLVAAAAAVGMMSG